MPEAERAAYRSHNPNLDNSDYVYLDEQNRVVSLLNPRFDCIDLSQAEADKLYAAHAHFRQLANDFDDALYSKLHFADWLVAKGKCSAEMLIRFLTDRSFYFEIALIGKIKGTINAISAIIPEIVMVSSLTLA